MNIKLTHSLIGSPVWFEPHATVRVWLTMLVLADEDGLVTSAIGGLACRAKVERSQCEAALRCLCGMPSESYEGRTVLTVVEPDRVWRICAPSWATDRVYFIQEGEDGPIKIGISSDPDRRLDQLQAKSARPLRLLGTVPAASRETEAALHRRFRDCRVAGEWFSPTPELLAYIAECR